MSLTLLATLFIVGLFLWGFFARTPIEPVTQAELKASS